MFKQARKSGFRTQRKVVRFVLFLPYLLCSLNTNILPRSTLEFKYELDIYLMFAPLIEGMIEAGEAWVQELGHV